MSSSIQSFSDAGLISAAAGLTAPSKSDPNEFTNAISNSQLLTDGNTVDTGRYLVIASNVSTHGASTYANDGQVTVFDKQTNTYVNVWGDPHVTASNGNQLEFQANGLTMKLDDGTQIEFKTTGLSASGVALIDQVAVTKNNQTVEISNFHGSAGDQVILSAVQSGSAHDVDKTMGNIDDTVVTVGEKDVGSISLASGKVVDSKDAQFNLDGAGGGVALYYQNYTGSTNNAAKDVAVALSGSATGTGPNAVSSDNTAGTAPIASPSDFNTLISALGAKIAAATNMTATQKTTAMNDLSMVLSKLTGAPPAAASSSWGLSSATIQADLDQANHIVRPPAFTVADNAGGMATQIGDAIDHSSLSASDKTSMKSEVQAVTTLLASAAPTPTAAPMLIKEVSPPTVMLPIPVLPTSVMPPASVSGVSPSDVTLIKSEIASINTLLSSATSPLAAISTASFPKVSASDITLIKSELAAITTLLSATSSAKPPVLVDATAMAVPMTSPASTSPPAPVSEKT